MRGFYTLYVAIKTIKEVKGILDEIKRTEEEVKEKYNVFTGDVVDIK